MLTKRTYFELLCDFQVQDVLSTRNCRARHLIYTRPESEGAASEAAIKKAREQGWQVTSKGAHQGFTTRCPEHRTGKAKPA